MSLVCPENSRVVLIRLTACSHRSRPHGFCQDQGKLLLRFCVLHYIFPGYSILLLPVRDSICLSRSALILYSETRQQTLEEIAAAFGDEVIDADSGKASTPQAKDVEQNTTSARHQELR